MTIFETAYYDVSCKKKKKQKKKKNKNKIIASAYVKLIIIKIVPVKFGSTCLYSSSGKDQNVK
jgi:hypothetical protein